MTVNKTSNPRETMSKNTSGLKVKGRAVLVKPYELQKSTLIYIPPTVSSRQAMIEDRAVVVQIGAAAWDDEKEPRAKVGDRVMISKFSGTMVIGPADGETYRVINDRDIYVEIEEEK